MARLDIYQTVTDRILDALERGTVPWRHPLKNGGGAGGFPTNLVSKKHYRGINVFLLAVTAWAEGYDSSYWMTYKQANAKGGQVRKGEKASLVVFWKQYALKDKDTGDDKVVPVLRHYNVFNAQQCDGIEAPDQAVGNEDGEDFEAIAAAESVVTGYANPPAIVWGGSRACYAPGDDTVRIPGPNKFVDTETYYTTLFHELAHSTGHKSRLDRGMDKPLPAFGSPDYSREELTAEMGAAFLAATAGISPPTIDQSAAYIDSWSKRLKGDKKLIVQAAGAGQRAADHILGVSWDDDSNTMKKSPGPAIEG